MSTKPGKRKQTKVNEEDDCDYEENDDAAAAAYDAANTDDAPNGFDRNTPIAEALKTAVAMKPWKEEYLKRIEKFISQRDAPTTTAKKTNNGSGGIVSALMKTRTRARRIAALLRAAISPAGVALIHGSVALTYMLESDRSMLTNIVSREGVLFFNVQNHPYVNIDHNVAMQSYIAWHDVRVGLGMEKLIKDAEAKKASVLAALGGKVRKSLAASQLFTLKKSNEQFNRSVLQMGKRSRMRRDCISTLKVTFKTDAKEAVRLYGSDSVVLGVITYRKMPEQVQAKVNATAFTIENIISVISDAREEHEEYFLSERGMYEMARRMRTIPSSNVFHFFDQTTYFENTVCVLVDEAVEKGLSGSAAVHHVFKINSDGEENQCQRAFGHWFLMELNTTFGSAFSNEYKRRVAGNCDNEDMRRVFEELLRDMTEVLVYVEKRVEEYDKKDDSGTKRMKVSSDPRSHAIMPDYEVFLRLAEAEDAELEKNGVKSRKRQTKKRDPSDAPAMNDVEEMVVKSTLTGVDVDDGVPLAENLEDDKKHTIAQMKAERAVSRAAKPKKILPLPSPSAFPMQFDSKLVPRVISSAEIPAASDIVRELGVMDKLSALMLRRTATEVAVGTHLIQTATNATTASIVNATRAAAEKQETEETSRRIVGADSRRMLNEESMKPVPLSEAIQNASVETGAIQDALSSIDERARAFYRLQQFDPESMEKFSAEGIATMSFDPKTEEGIANNLAFANAIFRFPVAAAYRCVVALQQSRVPARTYDETGFAFLQSDVLADATKEMFARTVASYCRMKTFKAPRKTARPRIRKEGAQ